MDAMRDDKLWALESGKESCRPKGDQSQETNNNRTLEYHLYTGKQSYIVYSTPPKFNIAPAQWWLEGYFPFGKAYFGGLC